MVFDEVCKAEPNESGQWRDQCGQGMGRRRTRSREVGSGMTECPRRELSRREEWGGIGRRDKSNESNGEKKGKRGKGSRQEDPWRESWIAVETCDDQHPQHKGFGLSLVIFGLMPSLHALLFDSLCHLFGGKGPQDH